MNKTLSTLIGASVLAVGLLSVSTLNDRAVALGGGTCSNSTFSYGSCSGYYAGNSTGSFTTQTLTNLGAAFGGSGTWSMLSDDIGINTGLSGTATTSFTGAGAIAIKAGNSYSLYTIANLASFNWDTKGVQLVGSGNVPNLSHIAVYRQGATAVPEPLTLLGSGVALGYGAFLKRKLNKQKAKKDA